LNVQIVDGPDRIEDGIINEARPLAQALLDAEIGDNIDFRVPGRAPRQLRITKIHRAPNRAAALA
jgi:transcription elongation GreA/GreB family factor